MTFVLYVGRFPFFEKSRLYTFSEFLSFVHMTDLHVTKSFLFNLSISFSSKSTSNLLGWLFYNSKASAPNGTTSLFQMA